MGLKGAFEKVLYEALPGGHNMMGESEGRKFFIETTTDTLLAAVCEEEGHKWTQIRRDKITWPDGSSSHKSRWECMRCPERRK